MLRPLFTALLGVALCLAGGLFDTASLYVPGVALVVLSLGAVVWVLMAANGATVRRVPGPHTVVEDEPYPLRVEVKSGLLPPPGGELLEPLLGWPVPVAGRWSRRLRINVRFSRRGRRVLEPELLAIPGPNAPLLTRASRARVGGGARAAAGRARDRPRWRGRGAGAQAGWVRSRASRGGGWTPRPRSSRSTACAPDREGAPASRIHWPSVARHGVMLERRLVAELDSAPLIVMDPSGPADEEALDKAVRAAASLCVWLGRTDGCAVLLPGDRRPIDISHDLGSWPAVHARLALVEEGAAPAGGLLGPRRRRGDLGHRRRPSHHAAGSRAGARWVALRGGARRASGRAPRVRGGRLHRMPRRAGAPGHRQSERGVSGVLGRTPAPATAGAPPASTGTARSAAAVTPDSLPMRLIAFAGLAAFGAAHWGLLVKDAPIGRTVLVLLVATGGAAALGLLPRVPLPRPALHALAAAIGLAMLGLGLMAAGLPGRLLLPANWSEFADGLDRGLAGMQEVEWPYDGPDTWIRRSILFGVPALLTVAATLAFWPARRGASALRVAALGTLLILYGTPVTENDPGAPALRGLVLLLLVGAWLWLPRMPRREAAVGAAVVASVGVLSLPVAAALDAERAWWNYGAWSLFGKGEAITFDWSHEYGPLEWSRAGATVLNVKSDRPHYWKAEALDSFDGLRWVRSASADDNFYGPEVAFSSSTPEGRWDYHEYNPNWDERIRFTVRSLSSTMVVGAAITLRVDGVGGARPSSDGTTRLRRGVSLEKGDSYFVRTYAPNPTKAQMEDVPEGFSRELIRYTEIQLPNPGESATEGLGLQGDAARERAALERDNVFVPLRGDPDSGWGPSAEDAIRRSPYERMYDLAQRLTADQPTSYAAVKNVERYLQRTFTYSERVPTRPIPLMGFLYDDKRGYCQQFSGAMALMLRMSGIPARVAAGFSPGSYNKDTAEYRVRDLDAHSWVEVWFQGIGWVPFDPTPARSPAQSQSSALATSAAAADAGEVRDTRQGVAAERTDAGPGLGSDDGGGWVVPVLLLLLLAAPLVAGSLLLGLRVRRLRGLGPDELAEVQLSELRRALVRLDWDVPASTTLLGLERRLGRFAGPASEGYARALRGHRYDPRAPAAPGLGQRRAVRRELSRAASSTGCAVLSRSRPAHRGPSL